MSVCRLPQQDNLSTFLKVAPVQDETKFIALFDGYGYAIAVIEYQDEYPVESGEHQRSLNQE
ncbi:hypothetical protein [uncultured Nostoc sp.]|uniref:hypothetical protein n=1 Tax=uncultured Nostoc sp. TaxID=340711 RepID=UPI0035CA9FBB